MSLLDVEVVALSECLVDAGFRLQLDGHPAPGIHYILKGSGRMSLRGGPSFDFAPHTLIAYSDAVEVTSSPRWLYTAGTPGAHPDGHLPEGIEARSRQAWDDVKQIVEQLIKPELLVEIEVVAAKA
jgi:hypothetical protein